MSQAHYDFIDFSITVGSEAGTKESSVQIRAWMKNLSEFLPSLDFVHLQPQADWIEHKPEHLVSAVLAKPARHYVAYLADEREVSDPTAGQPIAGEIVFHLPPGDYLASLYSPTLGSKSPGINVHGGAQAAKLELPAFRHDIVVEVRRTQ